MSVSRENPEAMETWLEPLADRLREWGATHVVGTDIIAIYELARQVGAEIRLVERTKAGWEIRRSSTFPKGCRIAMIEATSADRAVVFGTVFAALDNQDDLGGKMKGFWLPEKTGVAPHEKVPKTNEDRLNEWMNRGAIHLPSADFREALAEKIKELKIEEIERDRMNDDRPNVAAEDHGEGEG